MKMEIEFKDELKRLRYDKNSFWVDIKEREIIETLIKDGYSLTGSFRLTEMI